MTLNVLLVDALRCVRGLSGKLLETSSSSASSKSDKCFLEESSLSFLNVSEELPSVLGEMGTAGLGAELEQSRPILEGGFKPDGLGKEDGLVESAGLVTGEVAVLASDAFSEDVDDGGAGGAAAGSGAGSCWVSWVSLIFFFTQTLYNSLFRVKLHYFTWRNGARKVLPV